MSYQPDISIIIPTRNEAMTIGDTLQHYLPWMAAHRLEIIVSDALSTDQTADIVRHWAAQHPGYIRLVQRPGPQNIAIGRNAGAAQARGHILFHTDADVRLPQPDHFFELIKRNFAQENLAAFTTPIHIYPQEATWADRLYHWMMNTSIQYSIPLGWCLAKGECQIVRRSCFEQVGGYDETLIAGEDCNLFYRLQKTGQVRFVSQTAVHHSPRRFRQYGYWKISYVYLMEGLSRLLSRRSYAREWEVVR